MTSNPHKGHNQHKAYMNLDGKCACSAEELCPTAKQRGNILKKALKIINGERQDVYGSPEDSFALIAEYWNVYLTQIQKKTLAEQGLPIDDYALVNVIDAKGVAEMMMLFKIARMSGQKPKIDNYVGLAGYAGIAADMVVE